MHAQAVMPMPRTLPPRSDDNPPPTAKRRPTPTSDFFSTVKVPPIVAQVSEPGTDARAVATILLVDLVDSTGLLSRLGNDRAADVFARHDRLARELTSRHGGVEIDKSDGFLLLFDHPLSAVDCVLAYHSGLARLGVELEITLEARAAIHHGEIILRRHEPQEIARGAKMLEVEGLAKPTAARLMSIAVPRQTLLTAEAFVEARLADPATERSDLAWVAHGSYCFQGLLDAVEVHEVGRQGMAPLEPPADSAKAWRRASGGPAWRRAVGDALRGVRARFL